MAGDRNSTIPAVYVLLVREGRVLLSRRLNTGYMDGCLQLPSGHVDVGELPVAAAVRELWEEAGVRAQEEDMRFVHVAYRRTVFRSGDRVDFFFVCERWEGDVHNPEPHKCGGWEWYPLEPLPEGLMTYLGPILADIRRGVAFSEFPDADVSGR